MGTVWLCFFSGIYTVFWTALVLWALVSANILKVEWQGGFGPSFTRSPTLPDYEAVENNRREQAKHLAPSVEKAGKTRAQFWTDFRGPHRDGHYDEQPLSLDWPDGGPKLLWRQPIGGGYASFVVANGLAFTIEQRRTNEVVTAYDIETGREIWAHAYYGLFQESMGGDGPRATPTYYGGRIYSQGALGQLKCLAADTGKVFWSTNIILDNHASLQTYGVSASPLVVDNKVIVVPGGRNGMSVAAYDCQTSQSLWKAQSDEQAYSSPMLVDLAGVRQLLVVSATRAMGLRVEDGALLWEYPWIVKMDNRNIAQPVIVGENRVFLSAGYGTGCAMIEVSGSGTNFTARAVWQNKLLKNKFTSSVFWNGFLYGLDEDILVCLDAATGERKWKDGRYGYGQLLLTQGYLLILSGTGEVALVKASPERYEETARFQAIQGKTWNHPALAEGHLLVRNAVEMACFDLRVQK